MDKPTRNEEVDERVEALVDALYAKYGFTVWSDFVEDEEVLLGEEGKKALIRGVVKKIGVDKWDKVEGDVPGKDNFTFHIEHYKESGDKIYLIGNFSWHMPQEREHSFYVGCIIPVPRERVDIYYDEGESEEEFRDNMFSTELDWRRKYAATIALDLRYHASIAEVRNETKDLAMEIFVPPDIRYLLDGYIERVRKKLEESSSIK